MRAWSLQGKHGMQGKAKRLRCSYLADQAKVQVPRSALSLLSLFATRYAQVVLGVSVLLYAFYVVMCAVMLGSVDVTTAVSIPLVLCVFTVSALWKVGAAVQHKQCNTSTFVA